MGSINALHFDFHSESYGAKNGYCEGKGEGEGYGYGDGEGYGYGDGEGYGYGVSNYYYIDRADGLGDGYGH